LPERNHRSFTAKRDAIAAERNRLDTTRTGSTTLSQLLRRPAITYRDLPDALPGLPDEVALQVEIALKYEGYILREEAEAQRFRQMEDKQIPDWIDYATVPSLRTEARQKLGQIRPRTLGQANRISGITPSDLSILMVSMKRGPKNPVDEDVSVCAAEENLDGPPGHSGCCGDL
jgi:tRNA uridine 5-carboxymethylaminomethyl modification enzyme